MRIAIAVLLAAAWAIPPAAAGDTAERRIIGFAEEGRLFAFEEFGVQDGSGFPYSNIYVVDTDTDSWVAGTPIRVRLEEDGAGLEDARRQAETRLEEVVGEELGDARFVTLAHSPLGEFEQSPTELLFAPLIPSNPLADPDRTYAARLDLFHAETQAADCITYIGDRPMGFRLTVDGLEKGGGSVVLHEDAGPVPASRGCPITYRLSEIVVPDFPPDRLAVLISVFTPGFEGPDRRFIAVTGRLPE
ncbi:DUF2259 domain-containing protein [Lutibaculum baratangense]|uniref:DUF2259 domain-containing protein n=1 Tax=Lutibaculum baratangense AMV1 TaxID=631454 RepID=V4RRR4_9HYPH|nr:DUF2259 domain-containing protein [Lutibaculum baratangense]ESR25850.1 hypothetical protein N177_1185 [Lutibaculum baratangense AMV1]